MDYNSMTMTELREIARSKQLKSVTALKKAELVDMLCELEKAEKTGKKEATSGRKSESLGRKTETAGEKPESTGKRTETTGMKSEYTGRRTETTGVKSEHTGKRMEPSGKKMGAEGKRTESIGKRTEMSASKGTQGRSARQPDMMRYDSRPPRSENRNEQHGDSHSGIRSVSVEVQESPVYEVERSDEKKTINIRNEAFTKEEFEKIDNPEIAAFDSKVSVNGILEIMEGYGFIRSANYLPGENDVYVSPAQIRRFNLKTGDILKGNTRVKNQTEKFSALLYVESVNDFHPLEASKRRPFEELTPIFPDEKIKLEQPGAGIPMRITDIIAPIGKGQRGMIVSPPKAGKTTLLKQIAKTISRNYADMHMLVLLIDERPEEVTDIRESIEGPNVEVIYSTFDELPEHHKRVSEMVLERAKRLIEHKKDVVILLDSITRLARAYNLIVPPSGRTLTGGLDPAALHMPKKFFGAARNIREGGSLTILATALVETGSKMDDVVFEEFKGTGNMELVLDRKLSEKRIFPAIDIAKSSTRRDDLLLTKEEQEAMYLIRREFSGAKGDEAIEEVLRLFARTKTNEEFIQLVHKSLGRN
jgi:transcription termination factor Rho